MAKFKIEFTVEFVKDKLDAYSLAKDMEMVLADRFRNKNLKLSGVSPDCEEKLEIAGEPYFFGKDNIVLR